METSPVLLHDHTRDDVFKRFIQLGQRIENRFDNVRCPRIDLRLLVRLRTDRRFDRFFDHVRHFIDDETRFIGIIHARRR